MTRFQRRYRQTVCRTCGVELTKSAQLSRWTQCSVCYWRKRLERAQPLEDLLKRRTNIRARLDALPKEIESLERTVREYSETLRQQAPWWQKLSGNWANTKLTSQRERVWALNSELRKLKEEHSQLEAAIGEVKKAKKRLFDAQIARNAADAQRQIEAAEHGRFCNSAVANLKEEFDRQNFYIQAKDYRRGNAMDNYFREISAVVFAAFGYSCVFCGTSHDLTLDHYGLTKNEGGNFALITADKTTIQLNIVVLCRACNAAKAQSGYLFFFSIAQRERAVYCQRSLLDTLFKDQKFLKVWQKWRA